MTVQFTSNNTTLVSVLLRELCCLKLHTFDSAALRSELKVILDAWGKAKFVTGTTVHTRRLGKIVLKILLSKSSTLYVDVKKKTTYVCHLKQYEETRYFDTSSTALHFTYYSKNKQQLLLHAQLTG
jgi:hypothetical protein